MSPDPHPYDQAVEEWQASGDVRIRAIARNTMYDHRVSIEREKRFDGRTGHPRTAAALQAALVKYFWGCVRVRERPDYVYPIRINSIMPWTAWSCGPDCLSCERRDSRLM